jgi:superfamily I DNA/RNA helicase/RecB family exonuclease
VGTDRGLVRRPVVLPRPLAPDSEQRTAIEHRGSLRILGGPGTGKTRTLIEHAVSRLQEGHPADRLLVITFGRDRAAALRDEIASRAGAITREPIARTFHSLCFGLLRERAVATGEPDPVLLSGPEHDSILRDLLQGGVDADLMRWPRELELAVRTRGFARELRDLLSRATERGLSPDELESLAVRRGRADWAAAAEFYRGYLRSQALNGRNQVDPSALIVDTLDALVDPDFLATVRDRFPLVLVDEFQETDPSQRALLRTIAPELVLALDPDSAVGRFRGAEPETALESAESLTSAQVVLTHDHRAARIPHSVAIDVAARFRRHLGHRERACRSDVDGSVDAVRLRSLSAECRYIAQEFRRAHLLRGIPWSQMAVLVRAPGMRVPALQRAFASEGVPVVVEGSALALTDQSAVAPLITIARGAIDPDLLTTDRIEELLLSPYGGADPLSLRRLKQEFRAAAPETHFADAIRAVLLGRDAMADLAGRVTAPARRIADLIQAAGSAAARPGAQAENVLWAIWEAAVTPTGRPIREAWQEAALAGGAVGQAADADLDAVVALFEVAARFADRKPGAHVSAFFDEMDDLRLPGDTIAARAQQGEVVEIMTVHSAKGREWDLVAIAGTQEGEFPNLRLRGSLLGSELLVEVMRNPQQTDAAIIQGAYPALLDDERRLFHVAITRARIQTILTAVSSEESRPSRFFEEVSQHHRVRSLEIADLPRSLSFPSLIGELRRTDDPDAARVLRHLADHDVKGAHPDQWWGLAPLSSEEAIGERPVSPSAVAAFESCALRWFLQNHGGDRESTLAQAVGIAVHAIAEQLVERDLDRDQLREAFDHAWSTIDAPSGWIGERERARAWSMVLKLEAWHRGHGRVPIGTEVRIDSEIAGVAVHGMIDRIDRADDGTLRLVDLKTSTQAISKQAALEDPQLTLYQLAIHDGAAAEVVGPEPRVSGADLVYVGTSTKEASVRPQPPIDVEAARERLVTVALGMSAGTFIATPGADCRICAVRTSCPATVQGRQVTS